MSAFCLSDVAPRLALARDQFIAHRAEQSRVALVRAEKLLSLQRCVAHRELQLVRACATGKRSYIVERQRKLAEAQRRLRAVERTAA